MRTKLLFYAAFVSLVLFSVRLFGAWDDPTSGIPWMEHYSARSMGTGTLHLAIAEDNLGRLLVGTTGLTVHDGTSWKTYPMGQGGMGARAMRFDGDGRLWAGAMNELGVFTEPSVGRFQYQSLLDRLPEHERQTGLIWGVGPVGSAVCSMGRHKLYRWDGAGFAITPFPGSRRLFPLWLGEELWFHHLETGLYRVTESGPKLEYDPTQLPRSGILRLHASPQGLLLASGDGFFIAGATPRRVIADEVNHCMIEYRLAAHALLPDGNHIVGTVNGGLMIVSSDGRKLRIVNRQDHAGIGVIQAIYVRGDGQVWCASQEGIFRLDATGRGTAFHDRNGLEGGVLEVDHNHAGFYVSSPTGTHRLVSGGESPARFQREILLKEAYTTLRLYGDKLLLGRHGGIDLFDGSSIRPLYDVLAKGIHRILPSRHPAGSYVLSESDELVRLQPRPDGLFSRTSLGQIPDHASWLMEATRGRVWAGTLGLGAFINDPETGRTVHLADPVTGQPLMGQIGFGSSTTDLLVFTGGRVLRADPDGTNLRPLTILPTIEPTTVVALDGQRAFLLAFKRTGTSSASSWGQGLDRLDIDIAGRASWEELDVPSLESIGVVQALTLTQENGRPIPWLGGSEGLLRLDADTIPGQRTPPPPLIRLDPVTSGAPAEAGTFDFPFAGHRLSFRIFTGDPARVTDWRLQTRFVQNGSEWSPATSSRTHNYSNLSEGTYRFAARTVNAAGLASEPAVFTFRILPPWYRSKTAYASYAGCLLLGVWVMIRLRERRILEQNERLETQVQQRTAELVKANAAKDEFLAGVSHEMRNPMNGVSRTSEAPRTGGLDPESRRKFGLLRECASRLSSLLDLSLMQVGLIELNPQPFDLPALVDTVAAMAAGDSEKCRIPVEIAISPGVPRHLVGDPQRIRQILLDLISNALKSSGRGKVELTVWCQRAGARTEVIFAVAHEAPGIPPEEQPGLFRRIERGTAARGGHVTGTGLGLARCKGYAEKMGGRIWFESDPGRGSCFHFSAPFDLAPVPPEDASAATSPNRTAGTALVVDDQEYNRIVLTDLLARLGYETQTAADGAEALALADRRIFDLVFLDYDLPDLSGLEVARGIRALSGGSACARIFATTAFNSPEKQRQCLDAGMDFFLGKPVALERLRKALAAVHAGRAAATPPEAPPPTDALARLRLLASKKQVSFAAELALYLAELQAELGELTRAVQDREPAEAARQAHRLCGRCSFIHERALEQTMRCIEESATKADWPEAGRLCAGLPARITDLRRRLASSAPAVPPASAR